MLFGYFRKSYNVNVGIKNIYIGVPLKTLHVFYVTERSITFVRSGVTEILEG